MKIKLCALILACLQCITAENDTRESSPYVDLILCPREEQPWYCIRQQFGRVLNLWSNAVDTEWEKFKVEADRDLTSKLRARGMKDATNYDDKPSSLLNRIENGVEQIKDYAVTTASEWLGRDEDSGSYDDIDESGKGQEGSSGMGKKKDKDKDKKKKKPQQQQYILVQAAEAVAEEECDDHESHDHLDFGELVGGGGHGGGHEHGHKHGIKWPHKHATRGKKKKKRKAVMKLILVGSIIKAKIELLLKLLSAHLQIKFFTIALIGLLINLARFWIDLKRGHTPNKVVYVEHAQHQHHYDDHTEDWGGHGGYWKRSYSSGENPLDSLEDQSYNKASEPYTIVQVDPQRLAYRRQVPRVF